MPSLILTVIIVLSIILTTQYLRYKVFKKESRKLTRESFNEENLSSSIRNSDLLSLDSINAHNSQYKILIVDDDLMNRRILSAQLGIAKYNTVTAENGSKALEILNEDQNIDLVLLDIVMPDVSGFEICEIIRKKYDLFEKPVIMVTAKNEAIDLVKGFRAGANDFITKPYNVYELIARINSSINLKRFKEENSSLEKINKLKSELMDMAAHDLRDPLTIISGYAERIKRGVSEEERSHKYASSILKSSNKMLNIINKLLDESRHENGDMDLEMEKIDLVQKVTKCVSFFRDNALSKNQKIVVKSQNENIHISADRSSVTAILDNLISNAVKYSPLGSEIDVSVSVEDSYGVIRIKDRGNGFTEEEKKNMFVKYYPISNKPTRNETSTGLGLSIVHNLITKNRGLISVDSRKGEGSVFKVSFPLY